MEKRKKNNEKFKDMKKMSMKNPHFGDGPTGACHPRKSRWVKQ